MSLVEQAADAASGRTDADQVTLCCMSLPPSDFDADALALFLDVDGTLVDIEDHPGNVRADEELISLLADLAGRLNDALSLISGRSIIEIDRIFAPRRFPSAGSHGAELRFGDDDMVVARAGFPDSILQRVRSFADSHEGLLVEKKSAGLALHYRRAPDLEAPCRALVADVMRELGAEFRLIDGKKVLEIAPRGHDKGAAIRELLRHPPFHGRRPVFIGDDVTDEDGFRIVNELGGVSIRVGHDQETVASYSLDSVASVHDWLRSLADRLE